MTVPGREKSFNSGRANSRSGMERDSPWALWFTAAPMSLAKELRKWADRLDAPGYSESRRLRVPYPLYRFFGRVQTWGNVRTVLDVGANCGHFSRAAAQCFPSAAVHAFEPLKVCQQALQKVALRFPQVRVHPVALGERVGEVTMHENAFPDSSSLLTMTERHKQLWPKTRQETPITVPLQTLDGLREHFGAGPHFLKLDVQGYELNVLRGAEATLRDTLVVFTEVLFEQFYEGQVDFPTMFDFMRARGFRFVEFASECRLPPRGEVAYTDAVFLKVGPAK